MNISIERARTILLVWFTLLLIFVLLHCFYQIFFAYVPYYQKTFIQRHLRLSQIDVTDDLETFVNDLTYDGTVMLNFLTQRFDNMFVTKFISDICTDLIIS
jgi:hypothetical protein